MLHSHYLLWNHSSLFALMCNQSKPILYRCASLLILLRLLFSSRSAFRSSVWRGGTLSKVPSDLVFERQPRGERRHGGESCRVFCLLQHRMEGTGGNAFGACSPPLRRGGGRPVFRARPRPRLQPRCRLPPQVRRDCYLQAVGRGQLQRARTKSSEEEKVFSDA